MVRLATPHDLDFLFGLYMHPEVNPYLLYEPMTREAFEPVFQALQSKNLLYVYGDHVGMFKLMPFTHRTAHVAYLGGLAINPTHFGKGYGILMMEAILKHAKSLGLKRVELSTATINEKAIKLYEKAGFQREGILRKYTYLKSSDQYLDEVLMSCLL